jgi:multiple sugar transport system substrate-binding protein
MMHRRRLATMFALAATVALLTGCAGNAGPPADAKTSRGPITIWYSNNEQEVAWGKQMVAAWNTAHPDEKVTAQEIPAGSSSEAVIGAAIAAGNAPCLIYNTAPFVVAQYQKQGGLVDLSSFPDGTKYIEDRTGPAAQQYRDAKGRYYQLPWKSNPVMIFYNKKLFAKAGLDPDHPQLATYDQFLDTARTLVKQGVSKYAIYPSPTSQFYQIDTDFFPLFAAETGGKGMLVDDKATFDDADGLKVADFWDTIYKEKLAGNELYQGDAFADGVASMAIVGPWAVAVYKDVDWGVVPVPTSAGTPASETWTYSDAKNVGLYSACRNQATAWDVLKFSTSEEQDGKLLDMSGQMPLRQDVASTYASYFAKNPAYAQFGDQAARTAEVPNSPNAVAILQAIRDGYSSSVIFQRQSPKDAFASAAQKVDFLAAQP